MHHDDLTDRQHSVQILTTENDDEMPSTTPHTFGRRIRPKSSRPNDIFISDKPKVEYKHFRPKTDTTTETPKQEVEASKTEANIKVSKPKEDTKISKPKEEHKSSITKEDNITSTTKEDSKGRNRKVRVMDFTKKHTSEEFIIEEMVDKPSDSSSKTPKKVRKYKRIIIHEGSPKGKVQEEESTEEVITSTGDSRMLSKKPEDDDDGKSTRQSPRTESEETNHDSEESSNDEPSPQTSPPSENEETTTDNTDQLASSSNKNESLNQKYATVSTEVPAESKLGVTELPTSNFSTGTNRTINDSDLATDDTQVDPDFLSKVLDKLSAILQKL